MRNRKNAKAIVRKKIAARIGSARRTLLESGMALYAGGNPTRSRTSPAAMAVEVDVFCGLHDLKRLILSRGCLQSAEV